MATRKKRPALKKATIPEKLVMALREAAEQSATTHRGVWMEAPDATVVGRALKSVAFNRLYELIREELASTASIDADDYDDASACLEIMRAVDSGKTRLIIDLTLPTPEPVEAPKQDAA